MTYDNTPELVTTGAVTLLLRTKEEEMAAEGWDLRPRVYIISLAGPELSLVELPVPDHHMSSVGSDPGDLLNRYQVVMSITGHLLPEWPMVEKGEGDEKRQRPIAFGGIVITSEGWGLTGEAALKAEQARRAGRRTIPVRDRPDRVEMRSVVAFTVLDSLHILTRPRDEDSMEIMSRPGSDTHDYYMQARPHSAMADFTHAAMKIYERFGIEWPE